MLYWNPEPLVCKSMWFYVHSENVYLMFDDAINLKKGKRQTFQLKDTYKMSRAVWRRIRSKNKLEANYIEIMLQIQVYFIMDRLRDQSRICHKILPIIAQGKRYVLLLVYLCRVYKCLGYLGLQIIWIYRLAK